MTKKQLATLFLCQLLVWIVGNGLGPLLPVYATRIGAEPVVVGHYLSFSFLALAGGTFAAGWLSDRFQRRKALLIVSGVLNIPSIWLMGRASNIWQLAAFTATVWFLGGVFLTLASILAGLFAAEEERGKVFGVLALTSALGSLIGGATTGPIAERWGYPTLFVILALLWSLGPLVALFVEDKVVAPRHKAASAPRERAGLARDFYLLLLASLAVSIGYYVAYLNRSLIMDTLGFGAGAISGTLAIGGAVNLPLPLLLGWLSDRLGRKWLLILGYVAGAAGLLAFTVSVSLWHFCVVVSVAGVLTSLGSVGSAMVTDLVPQESLGRGMSLFTATTWIGGIIGFGGTGYAVQIFGMTPTFVIGAVLPLIAIVLLIPVHPCAGQKPGLSQGPGF